MKYVILLVFFISCSTFGVSLEPVKKKPILVTLNRGVKINGQKINNEFIVNVKFKDLTDLTDLTDIKLYLRDSFKKEENKTLHIPLAFDIIDDRITTKFMLPKGKEKNLIFEIEATCLKLRIVFSERLFLERFTSK